MEAADESSVTRKFTDNLVEIWQKNSNNFKFVWQGPATTTAGGDPSYSRPNKYNIKMLQGDLEILFPRNLIQN